MGSVVFDFDSTLVPCESLEALCVRAPGLDEARRREIARLTAAGMDGSLSFEASLRRRLEIARVRRDDVAAVAAQLAAAPTAGAARLVERLAAAGHEVWIVSGGFEELIWVVADTLGIPRARVRGVEARWRADGRLAGVESASGFSRSKLEGLRRGGITFLPPSVGVGDGATDLALYEAGAVDHFVAYTEHARRDAVVRKAPHGAASMRELGAVLEGLLS